MMKKILCMFVTLGLFALGFYVWKNPSLYEMVLKPNQGPLVSVVIPKGANSHDIAKLLSEKNILNIPPKIFYAYVRYTKQARNLKPGEYEFHAPTRLDLIVKKLVKGNVKLLRVTIPEGSTLKEIIGFVSAQNITPKESLLEVLNDKEFQKELNVPGPSFEGFLFPETYFFSKNTPAKKVVRTLVEEFYKRLDPKDDKQTQAVGFNLLQRVTLASIIEKESGGLSKEHARISSVFHNRLKKGMRLQTDPTVIYGIKNFDGNITRKHLQTPTPYNTYTIYGLPPGPIANPGSSSLKAAVYPETSNYLYFVGKGDGEHYFSTNYAAHNQAVRKYQLGK